VGKHQDPFALLNGLSGKVSKYDSLPSTRGENGHNSLMGQKGCFDVMNEFLLIVPKLNANKFA
jgi:hypothetical protein